MTNKARRVMIEAFVMEGYDDYGSWADDPSGTHMLVPVEVWERVVGAMRKGIEEGDGSEAIQILAEIGGEDE